MILTSRFETALSFAARLHSTQVRKGSGVPYVSHLLGVASIVLDYGGTEDEAIAGLLHDAVEDRGGQAAAEVIRICFGDEVADIVLGCTDADTIPKPPWRERKGAYIAHLSDASASIRLVSCADKFHNARAILSDYRTVGEAVWDRFKGGRDGTLWYYRTLADEFLARGPIAVATQLDRTVQEIERLTSGGA